MLEHAARGKVCLAAANDSRNGVFYALAALKGMTGPVDVFAGKGGFFQNTGSQFELLPLGDQQDTPFCALDSARGKC